MSGIPGEDVDRISSRARSISLRTRHLSVFNGHVCMPSEVESRLMNRGPKAELA